MDGTTKDKQIERIKTQDSDQLTADWTPTAMFFGYHPFPPVMNLYANRSGIFNALTTHKLCGATESEFLYLVELHFGYTSRGPLNFGRGYYLRNGPTSKAPVLAATGDEFPLPFLFALLNPETVVMLPPLDMERNPTDKVTETVRSTVGGECGVAFRFEVEVGVKSLLREEFEWRKMKDKDNADADKDKTGADDDDEGMNAMKGSRYTLVRLGYDYRPASTAASSSTSKAPPSKSKEEEEEGCEVVAELAFGRHMWKRHLFRLELKGAGREGELGERWSLMVVMTALSIFWMRQYGKTHKATIGAAQKVHPR